MGGKHQQDQRKVGGCSWWRNPLLILATHRRHVWDSIWRNSRRFSVLSFLWMQTLRVPWRRENGALRLLWITTLSSSGGPCLLAPTRLSVEEVRRRMYEYEQHLKQLLRCGQNRIWSWCVFNAVLPVELDVGKNNWNIMWPRHPPPHLKQSVQFWISVFNKTVSCDTGKGKEQLEKPPGLNILVWSRLACVSKCVWGQWSHFNASLKLVTSDASCTGCSSRRYQNTTQPWRWCDNVPNPWNLFHLSLLCVRFALSGLPWHFQTIFIAAVIVTITASLDFTFSTPSSTNSLLCPPVLFSKSGPSTRCSLVLFPSSHHVCRVGAGSLPPGWEWGVGGRTWQTPGEWCGGGLGPGHWAELPGSSRYLPTMWSQENHPLWWRQDVRYGHVLSWMGYLENTETSDGMGLEVRDVSNKT